MTKFLKFFFYPYKKKKLLFQSIFLLLVIRISLWCFSFRWLNEWLSCFGSLDSSLRQPPDWDLINNIVRSVRACSRYIPYASCLTQALATRTLLLINGQESDMKIGVKKDENEKFAAHAWIEVNGQIIIGKVAYHHRYMVLKPLSKNIL